MILYTGNPKQRTKILLELLNENSMVTGYEIKIQKSTVYYTLAISNLKIHRKKTILSHQNSREN